MSSSEAPTDASVWKIAIRTDNSVNNIYGTSNVISTTRYTIYTWLPKTFLEQFRRIANAYFILISILMIIGTYATYLYESPLDPYSTVATLVFVLLVTSIKEGAEDVQRAKSDNIENKSKVIVVKFDNEGNSIETAMNTQDIKAGDIIKLNGKMSVPADLLILFTSFYADGNQCFVETTNIDGETNLKVREAPAPLRSLTASGEATKTLFTGTIEFEQPNKNIHNFVGTLNVESCYDPIPLCADNMLLKGSLFSNTEWAYGVAVYTGQETKIQMNSRHAPSKMSKLEQYVNNAIIIIFMTQCLIVIISIASIYIMGYDDLSKLLYVYPDEERTSILPLFIEQAFVFFLLYNNLIPISLYVTLELVNLGQAYFISTDLLIYDKDLDCPCTVRSSNLVQELGLVSNVFSDKTGTLTRNEMNFVKFIVDDRIYDVEAALPAVRGTVYEPTVITAIRAGDPRSNSVFKFLQCITLCHTVVREEDGTSRAESPDELALVLGAEKFDCRLKERKTSVLVAEMLGMLSKYDILAVNAFNADRKRMSVLVRDVARNEYMLFCKGADSIMLELCMLSVETRKQAEINLLNLACEGLRTLCVARRVLSGRDVESWLVTFKEAANSIHNRAAKLDAAAAAIEVNLELLGITAIEDRLQEEVPEVISDLAQAGIVLWMLTGDKEETAINIGHACNLLREDTTTHTITRIRSADEFAMKLEAVFDSVTAPRPIVRNDEDDYELALIIDGPSLHYFDPKNLDHRRWLLRIGQCVRCVIGCRLTPIQKQQLVNLVKKDTVPKAITLAIGDGANDVSMIREADVGIGIVGKEGRQAANNADFSIGQFRFLRRLLLVHGRWNYVRQSKVFLYSMHKNMVLTLTLFWYSYYSAVSGVTLYQSWVYTAFNFTLGLPIITYGIIDQDISADFAASHPKVYSTGLTNALLDKKAIILWIFNAFIYAIVICLIYFNTAAPTFRVSDSVYDVGTVIYFGMVLSLHLKCLFLHNMFTRITAGIMAISVGGIFLYVYLLSETTNYYFFDFSFYYVAVKMYESSFFWFYGFFSVPIFCLLIDLTGQGLIIIFRPTKEVMFREFERTVTKRR